MEGGRARKLLKTIKKRKERKEKVQNIERIKKYCEQAHLTITKKVLLKEQSKK